MGRSDNSLTPKKDWKLVFIKALATSPNVTAAARKAKIARQYAYEARDNDPAFKAAWDEALASSLDAAEGELYRRAVKGTISKRYYDKDGKLLNVDREYSDTLLIFLLKAHKPEKYRETVRNELTGANGEAIQVNDISLTDQQRLSRIAELLNRAGARGAGSTPSE